MFLGGNKYMEEVRMDKIEYRRCGGGHLNFLTNATLSAATSSLVALALLVAADCDGPVGEC